MAWGEETHKGSGVYRARYRGPDGKARTVPRLRFTSKAKAEKHAQQYETDIARGVWHDPQAGTITFSHYYETIWRPNKQGEVYTLKSYDSVYRSALKPKFGDMQLRRMLPSVIQGWVTEMVNAGDSPVTIEKRVRYLRIILGKKKGNSAVRDGYLARNPCDGIETPATNDRPISAYEKDEVQAIIKHMDPWWSLLVLLAADTGMRWGELVGLTVGDLIGIGLKQVVVQRTVVEANLARQGGPRYIRKAYPKGRRPRVLVLTLSTRRALAAHIAERNLGPTDHLFAMPDCPRLRRGAHVPVGTCHKRTEEWPEGLPVSAGYFRVSVWQPAIARAGVPMLRFHDLRVSNISWLVAGGLDIGKVKNRAGHRQITTTAKYLDAFDVDDAALAALGEWSDDGGDDALGA